MTYEKGRAGRSVLVLSNLYPSSAFPGSGPFVRDQVRELARRNTLAVVSPLRLAPLSLDTARRVLTVTPVSTEDGVQVYRPWFPGLPVGGLSLEPRLWAWRLRPLVTRTLSEIGGDLIHAHFGLPDGYVGARLASHEHVPLVITLWGSDVLQLGQRRRARGLMKRAFAEAQALITVTVELAERAEAIGAHPDHIHVIPGGVPYPSLVSREAARALLGIDDDTRCVLWVGGLVPVKQPQDMIEAFNLLRADTRGLFPTLMLVVIGDGPLRADVRDLMSRKGLGDAVRLLGYCPRETVWLWECAADVIVNSSRTEGTPLSVLEAMGAGTSVAAYPLPGVRDAVDSVAGGSISADRTPAALASAIADQLTAPRDRERIARAARERFGIERTCRAIEDVYRAVA